LKDDIQPADGTLEAAAGDGLESLKKRNRSLSILYEIALAVGRSLDLKTILDDALGKIISFMGADSGVIYVIDEGTMEMVPVTFENLSDEVVRDLTINKVKVGECMCGNIAQCDKEVIIYEKASEDPRFTRKVLEREGMEFYAGLPLKAKGKVVGVLCVITHTPYRPESELLDILRAVTIPLGLAIENARLFEDTRKKVALGEKFYDFQGIIATDARMKEILDLLRKITDVNSSILIAGESGTGKELIAKAVHYNSSRKDKPFIVVNCAAFPETLLESEFFGYVKGAFTGASGDKKGLFEEASGGTIFLDEVESMSAKLQAKLLRVLQDGSFLKVGSTAAVSVDLRVIAATNRDLKEAVKAKRFREDLYYRLNVIRIDLPPLRERPRDIPLIARSFVSRFSRQHGRSSLRISDEAMEALANYHWPGNIRELQNSLESAIAMAESNVIRKRDLPLELAMHDDNTPEDVVSLKEVERKHIHEVLSLTHGNKRRAAKLLGINVSTLWRKLKGGG
jgi:transcriptional regulator with GAF, ATPase, and Fis domain